LSSEFSSHFDAAGFGRAANLAAPRSKRDYAAGKETALVCAGDVRRQPLHRCVSLVVGRKEQFEREFGQHHVDRISKDGGQAQKRENVVSDLNSKWDCDRVLQARSLDWRVARAGISTDFPQKLDQRNIGRKLDLTPQPVQKMRAPNRPD
jgi:hypothetical protein